MKRSLLAAALLAATATTALAASVPSQALTLRSAGYWSSWYIASNSMGKPMCGMQSEMNRRAGMASFMVKYTPGGQLVVHIFKSDWQIPDGTILPVALVFDNGTPWSTADAVGSMSPGAGGMVAFPIRADATAEFLTEFGKASSMTLMFTQGSEHPWSFNMIGSQEVSISFAQCTLAIDKPTSTQPYGNSGTTQPFGGARPRQKSTQPFGKPPQPPTPAPHARDDGGI